MDWHGTIISKFLRSPSFTFHSLENHSKLMVVSFLIVILEFVIKRFIPISIK